MPTCTVSSKFKVSENSNYYEKYQFERRYSYIPENREKDQVYKGEFLNGGIHGSGVYAWNNSGTYEGNFYSNIKEGYALLSLPNNSYFEGLFVKNQPFGPGILTHANGSQDAGFWVGQKLVRLSKSVDYIVPVLAPTSSAKKKLSHLRRSFQLKEKPDSATEIMKNSAYLLDYVHTPYSNAIYDSRSFFFNKILFENAYFKNAKNLLSNIRDTSGNSGQNKQMENDSKLQEEEMNSNPLVPDHCLCKDEMFVMNYSKRDDEDTEDICLESSVSKEEHIGFLGAYSKRDGLSAAPDEVNDEMLGDLNGEEIITSDEKKQKVKPFPTEIFSRSKNELWTEMLKQILRFRVFEKELSFNIVKLMLGVHRALRRMGITEKRCLQFLETCASGQPYMVKEILCKNEISELLMDARGNTGLMFAAAKDQHDIIDLLLDYGADANAFNDEALTPLNMCLLRKLALIYKVSKWETAFLPTEAVKVLNENVKERDSEQSLDRKLFFSEVSFAMKSSRKRIHSIMDDNKNFSGHSTITVLNLKKELGMNSDPNEVGEMSTENSSKILLPELDVEAARKDFNFSETESRTKSDKYVFDLCFASNPILQQDKKRKESFKSENDNSGDSVPYEQEDFDKTLIEKNMKIEKTIEKLLQRGADPNVSEVPKPSIHLAVFTKELKTVQCLLVYGADPDFQLHYNEGLLTPLHVVALSQPAPEYVGICQTLLKHGANPEKETAPEFQICEEEKRLLDSSRGRTPLHLLCMRTDLERCDLEGFLIKTGVMLGKASDKNNLYNGHSYLTLAMLCGNVALLQALLESKYFDPNIILGKDLGTALHVLVSTLLQMRTEYDKSLKMCDLLLAAGADPLKKFKAPEHLIGTCIDYGYREIEREKTKRQSEGGKKKEKSKGAKKEKIEEKDYLKDHVRVVEYLKKIVENLTDSRIPDQASENVKRRTLKISKDGGKTKKGVGRKEKHEQSNETEDSGMTLKKIKRSKQKEKSLKKPSEKEENRLRKLDNNENVKRRRASKVKWQQMAEETESDISPSRNVSKKPRKEKKTGVNKSDTEVEPRKKRESNKEKKTDANKSEDTEAEPRKKGKSNKEKKTNANKSEDAEAESRKKGKSNKEKKTDANKSEDAEAEPRKKGKSNKEKKTDANKSEETEVESRRKKKGMRFVDEITKQTKISDEKFGEEGKHLAGKKEHKDRRQLQKETEGLKFLPSKRINDSKKQNKEKKTLGNKSGDVEEDHKKKVKGRFLNGRTEGEKKRGDENFAGKAKEREGHFSKARDSLALSALRKRSKERRSSKFFDKENAKGKFPIKPETGGYASGKETTKGKTESLRQVQKMSEKHKTPVASKPLTKIYSKMLSEKLQKFFLQMFGDCINLDINELFPPYVVLRDGDLYYRFQGKAGQRKEQYSLV